MDVPADPRVEAIDHVILTVADLGHTCLLCAAAPVDGPHCGVLNNLTTRVGEYAV